MRLSDRGPSSSPNLTGSVFEGTEAKRPVRPFVVTRDTGGEKVWIENVEAPHVTRQILRRRLLSYHYRLIGVQRSSNGKVHTSLPPPVFDGPRFAKWLRKWMAAEGMQVRELAERSGVSASMIADLRRGTPARSSKGPTPVRMTPGVNVIAAIAHGLGLELGYVASKAGLQSDGDRWHNFTDAERVALAVALDAGSDVPADLDAALQDLAEPPTTKKELVR